MPCVSNLREQTGFAAHRARILAQPASFRPPGRDPHTFAEIARRGRRSRAGDLLAFSPTRHELFFAMREQSGVPMIDQSICAARADGSDPLAGSSASARILEALEGDPAHARRPRYGASKCEYVASSSASWGCSACVVPSSSPAHARPTGARRARRTAAGRTAPGHGAL